MYKRQNESLKQTFGLLLKFNRYLMQMSFYLPALKYPCYFQLLYMYMQFDIFFHSPPYKNAVYGTDYRFTLFPHILFIQFVRYSLLYFPSNLLHSRTSRVIRTCVCQQKFLNRLIYKTRWRWVKKQVVLFPNFELNDIADYKQKNETEHI